MILTGPEIEAAITRHEVTIDPFSRHHVNPNSYNYHLGKLLKVSKGRRLDARKPQPWIQFEMGRAGIILRPDKLYLACTLERIGSEHYPITLLGRSSLGRLGLFVQISAELGHTGPAHSWTLELHVTQPLRVYPGLAVGQICFWQSHGRKKQYHERYSMHDLPQEAFLDGF